MFVMFATTALLTLFYLMQTVKHGLGMLIVEGVGLGVID